jgi:hypothetical protein
VREEDEQKALNLIAESQQEVSATEQDDDETQA